MEQRNHQPDGRILINERIVLKLPPSEMTLCSEEGCRPNRHASGKDRKEHLFETLSNARG